MLMVSPVAATIDLGVILRGSCGAKIAPVHLRPNAGYGDLDFTAAARQNRPTWLLTERDPTKLKQAPAGTSRRRHNAGGAAGPKTETHRAGYRSQAAVSTRPAARMR